MEELGIQRHKALPRGSITGSGSVCSRDQNPTYTEIRTVQRKPRQGRAHMIGKIREGSTKETVPHLSPEGREVFWAVVIRILKVHSRHRE